MEEEEERHINNWMSHGSRSILLKLVLEAILVYWTTLAYIPKGTLEKIQHLCFRFLWAGKMDIIGIPLVK